MKQGGMNQLGILLMAQMQQTSAKPRVLDFGEIQEDYSLLTNTFTKPISVSDYSICRSISWNPAKPMTMTCWEGEAPNIGGWEGEDWSEDGWKGGPMDLHNPPIGIPPHGHDKKGAHNHDLCGSGVHYHDVYLPDKMRWIKPGDRVLVAWVGVDAVVIDIILNAEAVLENA